MLNELIDFVILLQSCFPHVVAVHNVHFNYMQSADVCGRIVRKECEEITWINPLLIRVLIISGKMSVIKKEIEKVLDAEDVLEPKEVSQYCINTIKFTNLVLDNI